VFGLPVYEVGVILLVFAAALTLWSMVSYLQAAWPSCAETPPLDRPGSGRQNSGLTEACFCEPERV